MVNYPCDLAGDGKTVVILVTGGPEVAKRCATPFFLATVLAAMDADVRIFLTMEGVRLAQRGVAENLVALEGGKKIIEFIRDAKHAGVRIYVCSPALPGFEIDPALDLIPEIDEVVGGGAFADLILSCDKVLSF
ncbi:MAG: DsrE family protein [Gammaproteobacteria bacterium]|nr:DsrE family protein [Gammaproteobacteria bacterium]